MKMKEVCALTGLTERTIRFYTEKKLVSPKTSEQNGRTYAEYAAADVDTLRTIAVLRRMLFSLEEIQRMNSKPKEIPQVLEEYYERIAEEAEVRADILALDSALLAKSKNVTELARQMKSSAARRRLPESDVNPNFGRLDEEPVPNAEQALAEYKARQAHRERVGMAIVLAIAAINAVASVVALIFGGNTIIGLLLDLIASIALIAGRTWARVLFVISSAIYLFMGCIVLFELLRVNTNVDLTVIFVSLGISTVIRIAVIVLLTKNACVHEYMYRE